MLQKNDRGTYIQQRVRKAVVHFFEKNRFTFFAWNAMNMENITIGCSHIMIL